MYNKNLPLNCLFLNSNKSITTASWQRLSKHLRNPSATLMELHFNNCNVTDEMAVMILVDLVKVESLKALDMGHIGSITVTGWNLCLQLLKYAKLSLEKLFLSCFNIGNEGAVMLPMLQTNKSLKTVGMTWSQSITVTGRISCFHSLIDSESISLEELILADNNIIMFGLQCWSIFWSTIALFCHSIFTKINSLLQMVGVHSRMY